MFFVDIMENIGYYEGILQLRDADKELIKFAEDDIKKSDRCKIAKKHKIKNGIDYYLTSQRYLVSLGKKIKNKFRGDLKINRKLYTVNRLTQKRVYRVTVLFRQINFKIGDIIRYRGKEIKVKSLGKKINGIDTETGRKISFNFDETS